MYITKRKSLIVEIACALLILLFFYATATKLFSPKAFRHDMLNQPFPRWFIEIMIWFIPGVEIVLATILIFERTRLVGLVLSSLLLFVFSLYAVLILMDFFPYVPCGCGGVIRYLSWPQHLVFNLFFTGIAILALVSKRQLRHSRSSQIDII